MDYSRCRLVGRESSLYQTVKAKHKAMMAGKKLASSFLKVTKDSLLGGIP